MQLESLELPFDADCPKCVKEWIGDCDHHFIKNFEATYAEKSEQAMPDEDTFLQSVYNEWIALGKSFWLNDELQGNILLSSLNLEILGIKRQMAHVSNEKVQKYKQEPKRKTKIVAIHNPKINKLKMATIEEAVKMRQVFLKSILKKNANSEVHLPKQAKQLNREVTRPEENMTAENRKFKQPRQEVPQVHSLPGQAKRDECLKRNEPEERLCLQDKQNRVDDEAWAKKNEKKRERKQVLKELKAQESFAKVNLNTQKKSSCHRQRKNKENVSINKSNSMPTLTDIHERKPLILRRNYNKRSDIKNI